MILGEYAIKDHASVSMIIFLTLVATLFAAASVLASIYITKSKPPSLPLCLKFSKFTIFPFISFKVTVEKPDKRRIIFSVK